MAVSTCYSVEEIIAAIKNADSYINKAADTGLYEAVDVVIDAGFALEQAGISDNHLRAIYYRWVVGLSQQETADILGIQRASVGRIEVLTRKRLQRVINKWCEDYAR